jgi:GDP-L-fucose synthase
MRNFYKNKRVFVSGHNGMLGSALVRLLKDLDAIILVMEKNSLDLRNQYEVNVWMEKSRPELIFHVGAKVGGIYANSIMPADFLHDNLLIQTNVIAAAHRYGIHKLLFVASNCIYPESASQPINEESILCGQLEENIKSYGVSKIAGIELCKAYKKQYGCNFISIIPPNLYGINDNYHPENSHIVAGIMRRAHEAKVRGENLVIWGTGEARRELLNVDDLARGMTLLMALNLSHDVYNMGSSKDYSVSEIAQIMAKTVGYAGNIIYDTNRPNGAMGKLLDSTRAREAGWLPSIDLESGLAIMYEDYLRKVSSI